MVSYAEVKSYLSKREIPQLFESLMAGLMYHRPENHIGYLQSCLDEVKTNNETKIHWSTFVNKKRKSKEILPPLTPKKQDSVSSSWSDNSRQSTPLPPISARTLRTRTSPEQQQDLRNTYILYHNPPPILAKPKVPVISVLGGLGSKIDELCEKAVSRLRGVVHISTCSMLKTRMTIEGFYRITSVPACAVVDSVLQAMSMVQSSNALIVAGFPRNRGDIEEYRSRRVRMDGVVLVDFEEEALRGFLKNEVSVGTLRVSDVEMELERYKQDIISVAEYYDEKQLLTVVMGDQNVEEMVEDIVLAVDKIVEARKDMIDDGELLPNSITHDFDVDGSLKTLLPSPEASERPSTVEIRDATEEDIKAIEEEEARNSAKEIVVDDVQTLVEDISKSTEPASSDPAVVAADQTNLQSNSDKAVEEVAVCSDDINVDKSTIPLLFAFENINADQDSLKDLIVSEKGMCYIDFEELVRSDEDNEERLSSSDSINLLEKVLQRDSVSYSSGFFICGFPFLLLKENKIDEILKLGDVTFICKIKEKTPEAESDDKFSQEDLLFKSPLSENVKIIFVTESNMATELRDFLQEISDKNKSNEISPALSEVGQIDTKTETEADKEDIVEVSTSLNENELDDNGAKNDTSDKEVMPADASDKEIMPTDASDKEIVPADASDQEIILADTSDKESKIENKTGSNEVEPNSDNMEEHKSDIEKDNINQISSKTPSSEEDNEDSTCRDVEDLKSDDTLLDGEKTPEMVEGKDKESLLNKIHKESTLSDTSMERSSSVETLRRRNFLPRQDHLDIESESISQASDGPTEDKLNVAPEIENKDRDPSARNKLIRQDTFSSGQEPPLSLSENGQQDIEADVNTEANKPEGDESNKIENESKKENEGNASEIQPDSLEENHEVTKTEEEKENNAEEKPSDNSEVELNEISDSPQTNQNEEKISPRSETSSEITDKELVKSADINDEQEVALDSESEKSEKSAITKIESNQANASPGDNTDASPEKPLEKEESEETQNLQEEENCSPKSEKETSEKNENSAEHSQKSDENHSVNDKEAVQKADESLDDAKDTENVKSDESEGVKSETSSQIAEDADCLVQDETKNDDEDGDTNNSQENKDDCNESKQENETVDNKEDEPSEKSNSINDVSKEDHEKESPTEDPETNSLKSDKETELKDENTDETKENSDEAKSEKSDEAEPEKSDGVEPEKSDGAEPEKSDEAEPEKSDEAEPEKSVEDEPEKNGEAEQEKSGEAESENSNNDENSESKQKDSNGTENADGNNNAQSSEEPTGNIEKKIDEDLHKEDGGETGNATISKVIDNDSDTNDEGSVTIETTAEVHAADSKSPLLVDNTHDKTNEPNIEQHEEHSNGKEDGENIDTSNNEKDTDNELSGTESKKETSENSGVTETTAIEDINNLNTERYSGKLQERNGSGILGESRQEDHPDVEEPQERSSSSSRGEL